MINTSNEEIIRVWTDPEYRECLTDIQRELIPDNPAGNIELTDEDIADKTIRSCTSCLGTFCTGTPQCCQ
ncbi:MAG: mersacidin/lichenicidin family type 2 lantibiotic [candidate division WOR-3 bacterium]